jgi:hypothetical protein
MKRFNPFAAVSARPYWWMYVLGIVILLASVWLWWAKVYMSPERAFWGMIENSLSTRGVTVEMAQDSEQGSIKQIIQMELGSTNRAHSLTTVRQTGTEIKTEVIGTRDTDYTRYRNIKTEQKNAQGKEIDFSKVVNVWSKSADVAQSETQASGNQLFAQALLGIGLPVGTVPVPIGELSPKVRERFMQQIRDQGVYDVSFKNVKKERHGGRNVYVYDVKIQTILYVRLMKNFATVLGMSELDQVDPNTYQNSPALQVKLMVDPGARQLVQVDNGQSGYTQRYRGYGLPIKAALPKHAISSSELQRRLNEL